MKWWSLPCGKHKTALPWGWDGKIYCPGCDELFPDTGLKEAPDRLESLVQAILKLPVGSSATDIEDCIRTEAACRDERDQDGQIKYVTAELTRLLKSFGFS